MTTLTPWVAATRPKTLAAGIIPVVVGSAVAYYDGAFHPIRSGLCLACAILIQIITNFVNEIEDFKRGADKADRVGPQRMVAAGLISVPTMQKVVVGLYLVTVALGLLLIVKAGMAVLVIGVLSLVFSYGYTGGPYPLAYKGLADLFVLIFFGLAAVNGTYFVLTGSFSFLTLLLSLGPGFLSMNILGVNNIRDIETDRAAGKNTLAVRLGRKPAIRLYAVLNTLSFLSVLIAFLMLKNSLLLLPLLVLPLSLLVTKELKTSSGTALNAVLAKTGGVLFLFGATLSLSFILSRTLGST